jgi:hypothetical protein
VLLWLSGGVSWRSSWLWGSLVKAGDDVIVFAAILLFQIYNLVLKV